MMFIPPPLAIEKVSRGVAAPTRLMGATETLRGIFEGGIFEQCPGKPSCRKYEQLARQSFATHQLLKDQCPGMPSICCSTISVLAERKLKLELA